MSSSKSKGSQSGSSVRVICRFRPQNKLELAQSGQESVEFGEDNQSLVLRMANGKDKHSFTFDRVFPPGTQQQDMYDAAARPIVDDVLSGYNGTVFAYGQTGSGKTYTMQGPSAEDPETKGIIPRMIGHIFDAIDDADPNLEFHLKVSYVEIYMEKIRDLLNTKSTNLKVREEKGRGIWIEGCIERFMESPQDVLDVMDEGANNRSIAATRMNMDSSRSHAIFILTVGVKNLESGTTKNGKLYLVDLAGSEKVGKTKASGTTLEEAKMINKSLSALGNVINSLTDGKSMHVPYRDSKLTRVLQESLGGNARTAMIINCSPSTYNVEETLSTLRFGSRAKNIKNNAKVNKVYSVRELTALLKAANEELERKEATIAQLEASLSVVGGIGRVASVKGDGQEEGEGEGEEGKEDGEDGEEGEGKRLVDMQELEELRKRYVELEKKYMESDEERNEVFSKMEELLEELEEKNAEVDELMDSLAASEAEMNAYQEVAEESRQEMDQLLETMGEVKFAQEKASFERDDALLSLGDARAEIEALKEELEDVRAQVKLERAGQDGVDHVARAMEEHSSRFAEVMDEVTESPLRVGSGTGKQKAQGKGDVEAKKPKEQSSGADAGTGSSSGGGLKMIQPVAFTMVEETDETEEVNVVEVGGVGDTSSEDEVEDEEEDETDAETIHVAPQMVDTKELKELRARVTELERERSTFEEAVRAEARKERKKLQEKAARELEEFASFKKALLADLENRCEKVIELQQTVEESEERYNELVRKGMGDAFLKRHKAMEREMQQTSMMHQRILNQTEALRKENALNKKKIATREARIASLEGLEIQVRDLTSKLREERAAHAAKVEKLEARVQKLEQTAGREEGVGLRGRGLRGGGRSNSGRDFMRAGSTGSGSGGAEAGASSSSSGQAAAGESEGKRERSGSIWNFWNG